MQKYSVCGRRDSGIFNSSHTTNIGSGHIVATTVRWTVVSDSPSSCAAKACSTISCGFAAPLHDCKLLFDEIIYNEDVVNILQYNLNIKKSVVIVTTNCYNANAYFYA